MENNPNNKLFIENILKAIDAGPCKHDWSETPCRMCGDPLPMGTPEIKDETRSIQDGGTPTYTIRCSYIDFLESDLIDQDVKDFFIKKDSDYMRGDVLQLQLIKSIKILTEALKNGRNS